MARTQKSKISKPSRKSAKPPALRSARPKKSQLPAASAAPLDPLTAEIARQMGHTLALLGENPAREGLRNTPKRYAKAMRFLTSGYSGSAKSIIGDALFREGAREMVIVRDIELFSLCEHHLLPFYGKAHVAYIPNGKVVGLSKIPRIVDLFARRLQVQERLTNQIAETLMQELTPLGVAVIIESFHLCMMMRGVEKQNSYTITSSMNGVFKSNDATRKEFLSLLGGLGARR